MVFFSDKVVDFLFSLELPGKLPEKISVMNPFEYPATRAATASFYKKYYSDNAIRHIILGINPGRFGAGITGIPFTDPQKLKDICGLEFDGPPAHEPSAVFVYDMIAAFGGPEEFYSRFYINSVCPLGFTKTNEKGKQVNFNYYDSRELSDRVHDFMVSGIRKQIAFGINTDVCFCLGNNKNYAYLLRLNLEHQFFKKIVPLEHPRYIMQYRSADKQVYIDKYLKSFRSVLLRDPSM